MFRVVLVLLRKFTDISQPFALFALSGKCQFSTFKGHKASINDYCNILTELYLLLPVVSEVVKC